MEKAFAELSSGELPQVVVEYRTAAKAVGNVEGNFGAFRPHSVAQKLPNYVHAMEIFMTPPADALFSEAHEFIEKLKENSDLDFAIWTQGEMNADAPVEQDGRGFQELKIEASGIETNYNPAWRDRLEKVGLSTRIGGLDKTSAKFFDKIIGALEEGAYEQVIFLDDKLEKLEKARENLKDRKNVTYYYLNRTNIDEKKGREVRDLLEVAIPTGRALVLCDYDGTLSDTTKIKADHEKRLDQLTR